MLPELPLFVFGTLRRGERNHGLLEGQCDRIVPARLRDYGKVGPLMIARRPGESVEGELCWVRPVRYAETMKLVDRLEGIPVGRTAGTEYERRRVRVETEQGNYEAWAYVQPEG